MADPCKVVLVGAGGMGRTWAANLCDCADVAIVAWVDVMPEAAANGVKEYGLGAIYTGADLDYALRTTLPDLVVDVTIPAAHHEVTLTALAAGVPVLGEKPMADTLQSAREMVAASERASKLYMVSQNRRYDAQLAVYRQAIAIYLGPLGILDADFYRAPHFNGFRETMASPLILDMAIHTFDVARYLTATDPVTVYCEEFNPSWSWYQGATSATAIFTMTDGVRFTYRGSWCSVGLPTAWETSWRMVGANGTASWDGTAAPQVEIVADHDGFEFPTMPQAISEPADVPSGIAGALRDCLAALETGEKPMGECHDNIKSLAMVFAAMESARTGQRVDVWW